jgi:ABC-2 type transport system ATP-binding protein
LDVTKLESYLFSQAYSKETPSSCRISQAENTEIPPEKGNDTMPEFAIQIQNFTKEYPVPRQKEKRVAVNDLTLNVPTGGLFGFLGPNGAGKTTTIKMLLGFIPPTQGEAWLFETSVRDDAARRRVGYLPEQPYFPKFLSALEVVRAHAGLSGLSGTRAKLRVEACLQQVGMWENRHMVLAKCSKGMTQRVGLASALVGDPDLLIMDEPSSGLDPVGRKELRALLTTLRNEGKTIFLSSHLLSEMESVCDHVGVMARGRLVACGPPSEITRARDAVQVQIEQTERDEILATQVEDWGGRVEHGEGRTASLHVPPALVYRVLGLLEQRRARLIAVSPQRETLEDAFLRLVEG